MNRNKKVLRRKERVKFDYHLKRNLNRNVHSQERRNDFENGAVWSLKPGGKHAMLFPCVGYNINLKAFGILADGNWSFMVPTSAKKV